MFGDPLDETKWNSRLALACSFNPKKSEIVLPDSSNCSFVPMEAVGVDHSFAPRTGKTIDSLKKGYTYFRDNDVLIAKITPCYENGKSAIASGCENGIGFGTTEFHVFRPIEGKSNSTWLLYLLTAHSLHEEGSKNMTGSAGQKRVPISFYEDLSINLPPISEQQRFAGIVNEIDKLRFIHYRLHLSNKFGDYFVEKRSIIHDKRRNFYRRSKMSVVFDE